MLSTRYFLKIAKINSQQEKPICLAKRKKLPIHKNKLPTKFHATRYLMFFFLLCVNSFCLVLLQEMKANKIWQFTFLMMNCNGASNYLVVMPAVDTFISRGLF